MRRLKGHISLIYKHLKFKFLKLAEWISLFLSEGLHLKLKDISTEYEHDMIIQ